MITQLKHGILTILLCTTLAGFAQKGFHIGASGTATSTWILNQNNFGTLAPFKELIVKQSEMDYTPTFGYNAGLNLGYHFDEHWGLDFGVLYDKTGQKYEDNFTGPATIKEGTFGSASVRVNVKRQIDLQYVQIPVMAKYFVGNDRAKFYVQLGIQFGVRVGAKETVRIEDYLYLPDSLNFSTDQKFKRFDFGIPLNLGVDVYIIKEQLYLNIGLHNYVGVLDINGDRLRRLDWYSKNDVNYQRSFNFRTGLNVGIHYIFGGGNYY
jgi:hypothetical protein